MNEFPDRKVFLSAEWRDLINLTYRVPADVLLPYLPDTIELDLWEGHAHLSLVAFDFLNTRVKGIPIPGHINFPEVNLRFYVRRGRERGVMFIKELVPKGAIAWTAKLFYNEPYERARMSSVKEGPAGNPDVVRHELWKKGKAHRVAVELGESQGIPLNNTVDYFFKEHDLGFGVRRNGDVLCYQVEHEEWKVRKIKEVKLDWDFGAVYGKKWAFLNEQEPTYALFAEGSDVRVYHPFSLRELPHTF